MLSRGEMSLMPAQAARAQTIEPVRRTPQNRKKRAVSLVLSPYTIDTGCQ